MVAQNVLFIQTWLQQYSRGAFLYSAHCSFGNTISLRSVWCRRAMIPGKIFTSFTEFQGIVSVNDFRLPFGLQERVQASLGFLWSFCFARICFDPLSGRALHHDCISNFVSRFAIVTEDLVICCYQVTKIFSTRYSSTIASCAWCPCNFGPFTDLAISVFREMSINTVMGSKDTSWEELAWESPCAGESSSTKISLNSCSHSGISEHNESLCSFLDSFLLVLGFLLAWLSSARPDLSSTVVATGTGEMSLSFWSSRSRVWISLTVGEEDELEEDDEQWLPCLAGVLEVDESDPEDELDKPGTTVGNEVLRVARYPNPVF